MQMGGQYGLVCGFCFGQLAITDLCARGLLMR